MIIALLLGALMGFAAAVPVAGPIAALVLSRALSGRSQSALFIALGASIAEAAYAAFAFYGVGFFSLEESWLAHTADLIAAVILLIVGGLLIYAGRKFEIRAESQETRGTSPLSSALLGFGICAANPTLLATWTTAMVPVQSGGWVEPGLASAIFFMLGVTLGAIAWNGLLVGFIRWMRERITSRAIGRVQIATGLFVIAIGVFFALRAAKIF